MGIKMGSPYFKIKKSFEQNGGAVLSSNYPLYGSMSARVMNILKGFTPDIQVYSIDEAFLEFTRCAASRTPQGRKELCENIINRVFQWTGLPVSVGLGPTKTLAKAASKAAKTMHWHACSFMHPRVRKKGLENLKLSDIWGIGRAGVKNLNSLDIFSVSGFINAPEQWIRSVLGVNAQRTLKELKGIVFYTLYHDAGDAKSIACSRSFTQAVNNLSDAEDIISALTVRAAQKLRANKRAASAVSVYASSGRFYDSGPSKKGRTFSACLAAELDCPSQWEAHILKKSLYCLRCIFRPGIKKAGITLFDLTDPGKTQLSLFSTDQPGLRNTLKSLNNAVDFINSKQGSGTLYYGVQSKSVKNMTKQEFLSKKYTTSWADLPEVKA
jgi:DNA polymerase V